MKKTILTIASIIFLASAGYSQTKTVAADTAKKKQEVKLYTPPMMKITKFSLMVTPQEMNNFLVGVTRGIAAVDNSEDISAAKATQIKNDYKNVIDSLIAKYNGFLKADHDQWVADTTKKAQPAKKK